MLTFNLVIVLAKEAFSEGIYWESFVYNTKALSNNEWYKSFNFIQKMLILPKWSGL